MAFKRPQRGNDLHRVESILFSVEVEQGLGFSMLEITVRNSSSDYMRVKTKEKSKTLRSFDGVESYRDTGVHL